jgi:hypothetical protein
VDTKSVSSFERVVDNFFINMCEELWGEVDKFVILPHKVPLLSFKMI